MNTTGTDVATWIATGATVLATGIAIWQAWLAKGSADRAEAMRNEIAGSQQHVELGGLDNALATALQAMDKYGPGRRASGLRGTSPDNDADAVRALTLALHRHRDLFQQTFGEPCDTIHDRLTALLNEFGACTTADERLPKGCEIYIEVSTFSGNMKNALDRRVFGAPVAS